MNQLIYTEKDIPKVAQQLKNELSSCDVMTFTGPLGAGKTTLIRELFKQLGIKDQVTSPTFAYMKQYCVAGATYYHFDLYRIDTLEAFLGAGFDEYVYQSSSKTIVEWPEIIMPLLTKGACHVSIDYLGEDETKRSITWHCMQGA